MHDLNGMKTETAVKGREAAEDRKRSKKREVRVARDEA